MTSVGADEIMTGRRRWNGLKGGGSPPLPPFFEKKNAYGELSAKWCYIWI